MTTLVATDLDRTLVHSARVAGPAAHGEVICLERRGTAPIATLLRDTAAALGELEQRAAWVPATARSVAEYARLDLEGQLGLAPRYVVCANGGVLLLDGVRDPAWAARVAGLVADAAPPVEIAALLAQHLARLPAGAAGPIHDADGVLLVARARHCPTWLADLTARCAPHRWRVTVHGEKLHVLPNALTKLVAVEEVRRRTAATHLLAAGDSPLDRELLEASDAGISPRDGRLHAQGWQAPHVAVTRGVGLEAGHEIARWLLSRTRDCDHGADETRRS